MEVSREDLEEMLVCWEDASNYKSEYLRAKHGDVEQIEYFRKKYLK